MKKLIHVNKHFIAANRNLPGDKHLPVYTVKEGNKNTYCYGLEIRGPSRLVDTREAKKLSCGARAWIETNAEVDMIKPMSYNEVIKMKEEYVG